MASLSARSARTWAPSLMPFLRPLASPRAATIQHAMRLSTTASRHEQAQTTQPSTSSASSTLDSQPALPQQLYFVDRTHSKNLPVYLLAKRGGNLRQTLIRKVEGDATQLKSQLERELGLESKEVVVNQLTNQVIIKGWRKDEVLKFLERRRF